MHCTRLSTIGITVLTTLPKQAYGLTNSLKLVVVMSGQPQHNSGSQVMVKLSLAAT